MLNEMQRKAVESDSKRILALAGAGSGKTHCMLSRIDRLINENVQPNAILALTFTNVGANEMKVRFQRNHEGSLTPEFCTFHSFCYSLISKNPSVRNALGYSTTPNLATEADILSIRSTVKAMTGMKLSNAYLNLPPEKIVPKDKFVYDSYWKMYNKLLRSKALITFDIMCYEVCKLFTSDNPVILTYKHRFQHIFVDEFQDTDPKQWEFVKSFTDSNIYVCGDPKQALYGFRGADSSIIKALADDLEWETIYLSQNYRSTSNICEYANDIHEILWRDNKFNLEIHSDRDGDDIYEHDQINLEDVNDVLAISGRETEGSVAILCRTNAEVDDVKKALRKYQIPFISNQSDGDIPYILRSAIDDKFSVQWLSSMLSQENYIQFVRLQSIRPEIMKESEFINMFGGKFGVLINKIMELRKLIITNYKLPIPAVIPKINELLHTKLDTEIETNTTDLIEYIRELSDNMESQSSSEGVYVGTIHSVKGAEFDIVHVLGVGSKSFVVFNGEANNSLQ